MQKQLNQKREIKVRVDSLPSIEAVTSTKSKNQLKKIFKHSELPQVPFQPLLDSTGQYRKLKIENSDQAIESKQLISTARKSPKLSKFQSPQFFSRKMQFRNNSLINLNMEVVNQIKETPFKDTNLFQIVNKISQKMNQLHEYKSEKAILSAADKLIKSHIRFQEIEWIFKNFKLKDWQSVDTIFLRILQNFTINNDNKLILKKNKPDQFFLHVLYDFQDKLDDLFKKLCDDSYRLLEQTILNQKQKLLNKEVEVMQQFSKLGKKESYNQFKLILNDSYKMNTRVMESSIMKQLTEFEDRFGMFKQIENSNRFISNRINDLVYDIKTVNIV
ncbi:unnamed protein product [Paramecium primaurelia]|uniref:Uncharacterized protein n=1 Tax=Paramecium primaurelia TaxID=5886 RepID=A0A8S1PDV2_PARPR|nr:unnamed protein product [Paramecium primaurelia]